MSGIQLPSSPATTPTMTYTVMWVDENGNHVEAQQGLSFDEAMDYVVKNKFHGFHSYPAAESKAVLTKGVS